MKLVLCHIPDIHAVDGDGTVGHIVKTGDQVQQRALAAAGGPDDGGSGSGFRGKGDITYDIFIRIRVMERDMVENHATLRIVQKSIFRVCTVGNGQVLIQDFRDTVRGDYRTGSDDGDHGQHQKAHDDDHGIGQKCGHLADLHGAFVDMVSADPDDQDRDTVHDKHHKGTHDGHGAVGEQLRLQQIGVGFIKTLFLMAFPGERADRHDAVQDLAGDQIDFIH